jgi:diaminopimelate decarboxylase
VETVTIAGKFCESGDVLIKNFTGPVLEPGDTLMVFATGAYNYSMASNYNRIPRPAMVMVENGKHHLLVRRETYEDLLSCDQLPVCLDTPAASSVSS